MSEVEKFRRRLSCKITVVIEMLVEGLSIVVVIGWDVFHFLIRGRSGLEMDWSFFAIVGYSIYLLGHLVALLILVTGIRVLFGPCQLNPQVTDRRLFKRGIKCCRLWCTLEFIRFILLLLGLSIRLMVFSLLAFDELTDLEVMKQSSVLIPLCSILLAMYCTSSYGNELETHLKTNINCPVPFDQLFLQSTPYNPM